jgi:acyl-coenzyme A synthetase/AMP-(fatty) acid ligase
LGEKIILVFEGTTISDHIISELMKTIKEDLDKYECPKEIRYIEKFPEAAISKINRRAVISILA